MLSPLAQAPVHKDLDQIFSHYCKCIDPSKVVTGLRMGTAELVVLMKDCRVLSKVYKEDRVMQVASGAPCRVPSTGVRKS